MSVFDREKKKISFLLTETGYRGGEKSVKR